MLKKSFGQTARKTSLSRQLGLMIYVGQLFNSTFYVCVFVSIIYIPHYRQLFIKLKGSILPLMHLDKTAFSTLF